MTGSYVTVSALALQATSIIDRRARAASHVGICHVCIRASSRPYLTVLLHIYRRVPNNHRRCYLLDSSTCHKLPCERLFRVA